MPCDYGFAFGGIPSFCPPTLSDCTIVTIRIEFHYSMAYGEVVDQAQFEHIDGIGNHEATTLVNQSLLYGGLNVRW
jgi:hypothetical protein